MDEKEKLKHCVGCEDNFYNNRGDGKRCWMLPTMVLISRKQVSVDQPPPWNHPPKMLPKCYHKNQYVFFEGDRREW